MSGEATLRVGVVAEGVTDQVVLVELIGHILGPDTRCISIQPQQSPFGDFGEDGSGWRGVRGWCRGNGRGLAPIGLGLIDILVVHLDVDTAHREDFRAEEGDVRSPCPPAADTADALREVLRQWLAASDYRCAVLAVPSMATDTWLLASRFPNWAEQLGLLECEPDPAGLLTRRPFKLLPTKDGKPKKRAADYKGVGPTSSPTVGARSARLLPGRSLPC